MSPDQAGGAQPGRDAVERHFAEVVATLDGHRPEGRTGPAAARPVRDGSALTGQHCLDLFDAQLASRHLDLAARWLRSRGAGYYTIGSSGHEGNAARRRGAPDHRPGPAALPVGRVLPGPAPSRPGLPATASATCCSAWWRRRTSPSPAAATRSSAHPQLHIIPQTSTIASHLPRAVGLAFALDPVGPARAGPPVARGRDRDRQPRRRLAQPFHRDRRGQRRRLLRLPATPAAPADGIEDNGIGISVRTPPGWVRAARPGRPGLGYFARGRVAIWPRVYDAALAAVGLGPGTALPRVPAPVGGAARRARRLGRGNRLPAAPAAAAADLARATR